MALMSEYRCGTWFMEEIVPYKLVKPECFFVQS